MSFSQEIINVLDYLGKQFGIAIDWTSENVMPYLQDLCARYISYEVYTSIAWIAIVIAVTGIVAIPVSMAHKKAKSLNWDWYKHDGACILATVLWIIFAFMSFISICVICTQVFDIIECYTLPEKVIFEYLKTLMDSVK